MNKFERKLKVPTPISILLIWSNSTTSSVGLPHLYLLGGGGPSKAPYFSTCALAACPLPASRSLKSVTSTTSPPLSMKSISASSNFTLDWRKSQSFENNELSKMSHNDVTRWDIIFLKINPTFFQYIFDANRRHIRAEIYKKNRYLVIFDQRSRKTHGLFLVPYS